MSDDDFCEIIEKFTNTRYLNKPEIFYRVQSGVLSEKSTLWSDVLSYRKQQATDLPLVDQANQKFWYCKPPFLEKYLHQIDLVGKKRVEELVTPAIRNKVILDSLIDEAFYSSVIEGAFSTKKRTKELVQDQNPKNKSETMILNNYYGLQFVLDNLNKDLNKDTFLELHKIITKDTLNEDDYTEEYRNAPVYITSENAIHQEPLYVAPKADQVESMMNDLFEFINNEEDGKFIHPIIKACILHFYIGYVHPFFDGNGRTARAFAYMYLLKHDYDFFKFFSISSVLNNNRKKYYKSFLDTEDYGSDLTYFVVAYSEITLKALEDMIETIRKQSDVEVVQLYLEQEGIILNTRQKKFLPFMSKKESNIILIDDYKKKFKISYETARRDLMELATLGIMEKVKRGKKNIFKYIGSKNMQG